jgi:BASS family bile acid:Na+ symporter
MQFTPNVEISAMSMTEIIVIVLRASIALSVFAIGLKAAPSDATFLFRRPNQLGRALLSMSVLMPLFALALILLFDLHPAVQIALGAISVSPIPPIFPNKAFKAGGTERYTIGLLVASCALSVIVIPVAMEIFERLTGFPLTMRARSVAWTVVITVFIPLLIGMALRAIAQTFADRLAKPMVAISLALLVLSALPVMVGMAQPMFSLVGDGTLLSLGAFALVGFVVGHLLGGPGATNRPTLALASATRHPAVALAIAHANFPNQKLAPPAVVLYLLVSAILSVVYLMWAKRHEMSHPAAETKDIVKA